VRRELGAVVVRFQPRLEQPDVMSNLADRAFRSAVALELEDILFECFLDSRS